MNNIITNQLASYRSRLAKLDEPLNKAIWEDQAPLIFTVKVEEARTLTEELAELGSRQSAPTTGVARDKRREEEELEDEAYALSRTLVVYARDMDDESLAAKYDLPISGWRRLRAEALLERVRLLEQDAGAIVAGDDSANAELYGINAAWLTKLKAEADSYEEFIVAPQAAISDRSVLTATLPAKSRETRAKFEQLEALVLQFGGTAEGDEFVAMFLSPADRSSTVAMAREQAAEVEAPAAHPDRLPVPQPAQQDRLALPVPWALWDPPALPPVSEAARWVAAEAWEVPASVAARASAQVHRLPQRRHQHDRSLERAGPGEFFTLPACLIGPQRFQRWQWIGGGNPGFLHPAPGAAFRNPGL